MMLANLIIKTILDLIFISVILVIEISFSRQTHEAGGGSSKGSYSPSKESDNPLKVSSDIFQNNLGLPSLVEDERIDSVPERLAESVIIGGVTEALGGGVAAKSGGASPQIVIEAAVLWGVGSAVAPASTSALDLMNEPQIAQEIAPTKYRYGLNK